MFELRDRRTRNVVAFFKSESEAINFAATRIPRARWDDLTLGHENRAGKYRRVLSGSELASRLASQTRPYRTTVVISDSVGQGVSAAFVRYFRGFTTSGPPVVQGHTPVVIPLRADVSVRNVGKREAVIRPAA